MRITDTNHCNDKKKDGGRDRDRTCDPYDVNTVVGDETSRDLGFYGSINSQKSGDFGDFLGRSLGAQFSRLLRFWGGFNAVPTGRGGNLAGGDQQNTKAEWFCNNITLAHFASAGDLLIAAAILIGGRQ